MLKKWSGYAFAMGGTILAVLVLLPFRGHVNTTPVALSFLLVVLFTAVKHGRNPAVAASILSLLCFNFFFTVPYHNFTVADPQNWIALAAFFLTALVAGDLSAREKKRAQEAQLRKDEIERLYGELKGAFEKVSEAEALKKSEQLKSALLDAVTHDLRTPLTSMKAAVTAIIDSTSEELDEVGRRELLDVVNIEIDRLNHFLENLIEMAKIESGAVESRRAWSTIEEILSIAITRASEIASRHNVRVQIENDLPPLRVDEKAIAEVLYILIENATKYSRAGTDIVIHVERKGDDTVKVSVRDYGIGVPKDLRQKVFEKFFRLQSDSSSSPSAPGLGMGLAIARGLIEAHKGRIWIEDNSNEPGTHVSFELPLSQKNVAEMIHD